MTAAILYVDSVPYLGGAEISLLTLAAGLNSELYAPHLVTTVDGPLAQRAEMLGIPVYFQTFPWLSRRRPWIYAGSIWQLVRTIRCHEVRLMHTNGPHCLPHVRAASWLTGVPYIAHVRDLRVAWFDQSRLAALNDARWVIANSQYIAEYFAHAGVDVKKIEVIYNPIDVDSFMGRADAGQSVRQALSISRDVFLIGIVGQIQKCKGHDVLVESAPTVIDAVPNVHFLVVGAAATPEARAYEEAVRGLIREKDLKDHFHLVGFREDIPMIMQALDVLVVTSRHEGFGRVVVEALAAGCPVVATSVGGIPEILTHESEGLLVPANDAAALAAALIRMANDHSFRKACIHQGPKSVLRFAPTRHVEQVQSLYANLLMPETGPVFREVKEWL